MNDINFDSVIRSNISENSINYILDDETVFNEVGYKVLQNQERFGLVKCGKLFQNGKIKLVYDVTRYKPLSTLLAQINHKNFLLIVSRLYDVVKYVEENGFIRCENIDLGMDKIFVESEDLSVHLICLPINNVSRYQNTQLFYEGLKQIVLTAANTYPDLSNAEVIKIIDTANNNKKTNKEEITPKEPAKPINNVDNNEQEIEQVKSPAGKKNIPGPAGNKRSYRKNSGLGGMIGGLFSKGRSSDKDKKGEENTITLVSTNTKNEISFLINKPIFIIGKQAGTVDGVITDEKTISRVHCKIIRENKKYYIQDMGSLNGTYVNNRKMAERQKVLINRGDIIKLSKMEFIVK